MIELENHNKYRNWLYRSQTSLPDVQLISEKNQMPELEKNLIILADDNYIINICNKKIISDILQENERSDFDILCVNDGIDILKLFFNNEETERIKLIITDENMDYLNGSEAIKVIRNIEKLKNKKKINIVSLSCNEEKSTGEIILKAGADYILIKPLSKQSIKSLLDKKNLFT